MATAHGAGLMALPFVLGGAGSEAHAAHAGHGPLVLASVMGTELPGLWGTLAHRIGYLAVTLLCAVVVYEKVGVGVLRRLWVNIDLVWAVALIATGMVTVVV